MPGVPDGTARLQKRSRRGHWFTARRPGLRSRPDGFSQYALTVRSPGAYRVLVEPRDGFAHVSAATASRRLARRRR